MEEVRNPAMMVAVYATGGELGKQRRMPDDVEFSSCVQRDGPDLLFDMYGIQPLLRDEQQYVQS